MSLSFRWSGCHGFVALSLAVLFSMSACGGSSDAGNNAGGGGSGGTGGDTATGGSGSSDLPDFSTGVDGDALASDLTPEEEEQLCEATQDYLTAAIPDEDVCRVTAVISSALLGGENVEAACQAVLASCLAEGTTAVEASECVVPDDCNVTVDEYETCVEDALEGYVPLLNLVPDCEGLEVADLLPLLLLAFQDPPESCAVVEQECPGLAPTVDLSDVGTGGTNMGGATGNLGGAMN